MPIELPKYLTNTSRGYVSMSEITNHDFKQISAIVTSRYKWFIVICNH